jgi:hypothetical protein
MGRVGSRQGEETEIHIGFWWETTNETDQWENLGIDGRALLKMLHKSDVRM